MQIGRMIAPVRTLGPGDRVCLWVQGCDRQCPGCISPELRPRPGSRMPVHTVAKLILEAAERSGCTGLTISGGEPFDQPEELDRLLSLVRSRFSDILVYTGYTLEELQNRAPQDLSVHILKRIDVLIDGPYVESENTPSCVLRGSANQVIHFFNKDMEPLYRQYMAQGRCVEVFSHGSSIIRVGIPNRGD